MTRWRLAALAIAVTAGALIASGFALIYPPAGLIVGGLLLGGSLFVVDVDLPRRARR